MADPSRVRISGPLEPFAADFLRELSRQGYTAKSTIGHAHLLAHVSRWLADIGLTSLDLSETAVGRFLDTRRASGYTHYLTSKALQPMLHYLRGLGVAPMPAPPAPDGPVERALECYRRYLEIERGVGSTTACGYLRAIRPFLQGRISDDGLQLDLEHLNAADVTAFVVARCQQQSVGAAKVTVTALRSFLRFLHVEGTIGRSLSAAVPSVAGWRLTELPKGLEPAQVRSLLASCDRRTGKGRRDFAILTMLVRLGLRAGEIAVLRIDDIDWRAGELIVKGKGSRAERLPLPPDVGDSVVAYLRRGRPATAIDRTVFVRTRAPLRALTSTAISKIVADSANRAGLGNVRAHRLRHTAATLMIRNGATLAEIGQVLRHRRALTTAIYAKVDREALRTIAQPWPGGAE